MKPFATYSANLASPDATIEVLQKAVRTSLGQQVVTHLSVPKDMFEMPATVEPRPLPAVLEGASTFTKESLEQIAGIMKTAKRPMILAGSGVAAATEELEKLANLWGAGILTSLGGKGLLDESSLHNLQGIGEDGKPYGSDVFKEADVVLLAGTTWWPEGYVPTGARIIQIDRHFDKFVKDIPTELGIIGKTEEVLPILTEGLPGNETSIQMDLVRMGERPYEEMQYVPGIPTGLNDVDKLLDGFQPAELTVIAARPSMGKTDTLNHFALHAGLAGYKPVIFSLEMSRTSMIDRFIAIMGGYNRLRMRNPYTYFTEEQKARWLPTLARLNEANLHIDDSAGMTVSQMRAVTRKIMHTEPKLKPIVFIDYLQIIRSESKSLNRTETIGQISNDLKQMAKEFNCPVICLSQLNRSVEARDNKRPIMSDLRDSGNIEQDADVIGFLYRDDYYNKDTNYPGLLEINIAKHRNGPTGTATVRYVKETGILHNMDWEQQKRRAPGV